MVPGWVLSVGLIEKLQRAMQGTLEMFIIYIIVLYLFVPFFSKRGCVYFSILLVFHHVLQQFIELSRRKFGITSILYFWKRPPKAGKFAIFRPVFFGIRRIALALFQLRYAHFVKLYKSYFFIFELKTIFNQFKTYVNQVDPRILYKIAIVLSQFILVYVWQFDSLLPGSTFLYTHKYSPLRIIWKWIYHIGNRYLLSWWFLLLFNSAVILIIHATLEPILFFCKHLVFDLGLLFYFDYVIVEPIFGISIFYRKAILTIVDIVMGVEYIPYFLSIGSEIKLNCLNRIAYWFSISTRDPSFRVYFFASSIFLFTGFIKLSFDILEFFISNWLPYFLNLHFDEGYQTPSPNTNVTSTAVANGNLLRPIESTNTILISLYNLLRYLSQYFSILGFTLFALLFLVWDNPQNSNFNSCMILSIPLFFVFFYVGELACRQGGPFYNSPFQLIGLIYSIYAQDVEEAEASASSIFHSSFMLTDWAPLRSPLDALESEFDKRLALNIPHLAVALLCDTGIFASLFDAWSIARPIIRAFSIRWITSLIENLSIFNILETLKGNEASSIIPAIIFTDEEESDFDNDGMRPDRVHLREEREESLLTDGELSWSPMALVDSFILKNYKKAIDVFKDDLHYSRHFFRMMLEAAIYSALISANIIQLPRGSLVTTAKHFFWIIWCLSLTTFLPRSIPKKKLLNRFLFGSSRNLLRSIFWPKSLLFSTSVDLYSTLRNSLSHIPLPVHDDSKGTFILWLSKVQAAGYSSLSALLPSWALGLPPHSNFWSIFSQRHWLFLFGIWTRSSIFVQLLLLFTAGGLTLMAFFKPWNWMDLLAFLVFNSIKWGYAPSIRLASDQLYSSTRQRRVDESLVMWMTVFFTFSLGLLWWALPHMPLRLARPSRIFFHLLFFRISGNLPYHLFNLVGGYGCCEFSLVCTGILLVVISILQLRLYRFLLGWTAEHLLSGWNGIKISYAQGEAVRHLNKSVEQTDSLLTIDSCPSVSSYWLDELAAPLIGPKEMPIDRIYPDRFTKKPNIFDIIDWLCFGDDLREHLRQQPPR